MHTYAEVLTYAIPFFMVLILIEFGISRIKGVSVVRSFDTVSSLSSGLTNSLKEVLGLAIVIISYGWMVEHLSLFQVESKVWLYVLTFIGLDFAGYWAHRFEHKINILWNRHIIHHSSEEFNLACALRQNVSAVFGVFFFLLIPLAIIGVPGEVIALVAPLHLFAQFWYHTRLIDKMSVLEHIIVTPSHHRVHHAINDIYMDRNFGQVFILWDKWFGSFQEELVHEVPVYGVKRQANTWNPFLINFQHLWILLKDSWNTKSWSDKLKVFIKPTGWRPADREISDPIPYTKIAEDQVKYQTGGTLILHIWIWSQMVITVVLMLYMFQSISDFSFLFIVLYGLFLAVSIFSYTSLMDRSKLSIPFEIVKIVLGLGLIYQLGDWFGLDEIIPFGTALIVIYLIISLSLNIYFLNENKELVPNLAN
ncbi:MAG: sterol desaturase/sphingolipid hydroxylase (fatty acid hydroxylase superfamily) [Halioglobus sp.]|jgi:sterol desaturase/sphingolipid hydroxylase (fatty acid hydroxylase superfamily)